MSKLATNKDLRKRALGYINHMGTEFGLGGREWAATDLPGDSESRGRVKLTEAAEKPHIVVLDLDRELNLLVVEIVFCPGCGSKWHDREGFRENSVKRELNRLEKVATS